MRKHNRKGGLLIAASLAFALPLAACSGSEEAATGETVSNDTLASQLASADSLSTASSALNDSGLGQVFDGTANYTLLAPDDAAFEAASSLELDDPANRALLAEVLRDHILPGAMSGNDIGKAIDDTGGPVEMTTMGDTTVTFTKADDGTITVSSSDGSEAHFAGDAVMTSNGSAIPIDTILRKI